MFLIKYFCTFVIIIFMVCLTLCSGSDQREAKMDNGILTKPAFVPLTTDLNYFDNQSNTVNHPNNSVEDKEPTRPTTPARIFSNNTFVMRNGKMYRVVKVKKNVRHFKEPDERLQKRTFRLLPGLLSMLPMKWMTRDKKKETDPKLENETHWSKSIPDQSSEETSTETIKHGIENSEKIKKLLNLFTIVKFDHSECYADGIKGTCLHQSECEEKGWKYTGSCARNLGVCCYSEKTCGQESKENCTYFVNEGFPESSSAAPKVCTLTLDKADSDVKQLRIDFLSFQLRDPLNGTCLHDRLVISGQDTNNIVPEICGFNTGQHIYVDVEDSNGPYNLNIITVGEYFPRNFRLKVTQLKKSNELAPKNCLQYYTEPTGIVQTFNYQHQINENVDEITSGYFNNLNYAICVKKLRGFCSITYENEEEENEEIEGLRPTFQLVNVDVDGERLLPPYQAGAETFDCPDDYIVLNGIRLCGEKLNDASVEIDFTKNYPVTDMSNGPFILSVKTNSAVSGRGFYLKYSQNPCLF